MTLKRYTKTISTAHITHVAMEDGKGRVHITNVFVLANGKTEEQRMVLAAGDTLTVSHDIAVPAPDGKSIVKAVWSVLLDILGFKEVASNRETVAL